MSNNTTINATLARKSDTCSHMQLCRLLACRPAVILSFLIAGISALLSALCYSEFAAEVCLWERGQLMATFGGGSI